MNRNAQILIILCLPSIFASTSREPVSRPAMMTAPHILVLVDRYLFSSFPLSIQTARDRSWTLVPRGFDSQQMQFLIFFCLSMLSHKRRAKRKRRSLASRTSPAANESALPTHEGPSLARVFLRLSPPTNHFSFCSPLGLGPNFSRLFFLGWSLVIFGLFWSGGGKGEGQLCPFCTVYKPADLTATKKDHHHHTIRLK
jgi:hypothetical protein